MGCLQRERALASENAQRQETADPKGEARFDATLLGLQRHQGPSVEALHASTTAAGKRPPRVS